MPSDGSRLSSAPRRSTDCLSLDAAGIGDALYQILFTVQEDERRQRLMKLADSINRKFGDDSITFGG